MAPPTTKRPTTGAAMWGTGTLGGPPGGLRAELVPMEPTRRLADLVLEDDLLTGLRRVLREHERSRELYASGFAPTRKVLLHGPPGCGKTSTGEAMASELGLPLVRVDAAMVVRSHLGETGQRLGELFRAMDDLPGVWLLDEVDAMAPARGAGEDIAEMSRAVAAVLTGIERWKGIGLVIACTNLPDRLDRALWRRFDVVLGYAQPSPMHLARIARRACGKMDVRAVAWHEVEAAVTGRSAADVEAATRCAAVDAILDGRTAMNTDDLVGALRVRHRA